MDVIGKFALRRRQTFAVVGLLITIFFAISTASILFASDNTLSILAADSPSAMGAGHDDGSAGPLRSNMSDASQPNFYSEMTRVNTRMHENMQIMPSGDPDHDFMRMMIPHHQGAIDMALVLLKYGRDEKLKRLAQSIIIEQGQEIAYMRSLLATPSGETSNPKPTMHQ